MTRTGVLSLLIAAYAVTNIHQAYAEPIESNPRFLQDSRNMQAYMFADPTTDLTQLTTTYTKVFNQFIDSTAPRLEGHITTDKIYYRAKDAVFIDLLLVNSLDKTPYTPSTNTNANLTVSLLNSNGDITANVAAINKLLVSGSGPAHGFTFKLPDTITDGKYLVVATHPLMATATRTIVVQKTLVDAAASPSTPNAYDGSGVTFYGTTFQQQFIAGSIQILKPSGDLFTDKSQLTVTATWTGQSGTAPSASVYSGPFGTVYFYVDLSTNVPTLNTVVTVSITGALPNPANAATTVPVNFQNVITIGAAITNQQPDTNNNVVQTTDYQRFEIFFFTESMADLVPGTPQVVYFRAFVQADANTQVPTDFTGASLYAYNPNLPSISTTLIQSGISSIKNGYGVLSEFRYDDSKIYYLEFTPTWTPTSWETVLTYPIQKKIVMKNGALRIPLIIEGIQTRLSNIEKELDKASSASFPQYLLNDYIFSKSAVAITGTTFTGTFDFGYSNGFFFVKVNYPAASNVQVKYPPLLVFNNFPSPDDFSNLLLDYTKRHMEGLVSDSTQTASVAYPIDGTEGTKLTFKSAEVSASFFGSIYEDMVSKFSQTQMDKFLFNKTTVAPITVDYHDGYNYEKLSMVFRQVPFVPQDDSKYFGKYGPLTEQTPMPDLYTTTDLIDDSKLSYPQIVMSIKDKVLENTQDLVVLISTNSNFDAEDVYILQVKQKEIVKYTQIVKLKARQYKEKYFIPASNFASTNGGVYQVNLYKIRDDYKDYIGLIGTQDLCNIQTLTSSVSSMGTTDQQKIDSASKAVGMLDMRIYDALNKVKISVPGTTCILMSPSLVSRFTESVGSITILKKPASTYEVEINTVNTLYPTVATSNFVQGSNVKVTLKIKNTVTGAYLPDTTASTFATLFVTEDVDLASAAFYKSSSVGKIYLENEVDFEKHRALDPLSQVNQHYTVSSASSASQGTDTLLDILLTINNLRNSVFDTKVYSLFFYNQDVLNVYKKAIPHTFERLSQLFGYNFQKNTWVQGSTFSESDIRNYANAATGASQIKSNIVNFDGAATYRRTTPTIDVFSAVTSAQLTEWALTLPGGYNAIENKYMVDTTYFGTNLPFSKVGLTDTFTSLVKTIALGDIPSNFKIIAQTYGPNGYGYGEKTISVGAAFKVDFTLPDIVSAGDIVNVTATISNSLGLAMTITPSIDATLAPIFTADFTYQDWAKNAQNQWVATTRTQWPFTSSQTSRQIPFLFKAGVGNGAGSVLFTFTATVGSATYSAKVTKQIQIVQTPNFEPFYASGELQTNQYPNDQLPYKSTESLTVTLPTAEQIAYKTYGEVTLFPTQLSYLIGQSATILLDNVVDNNLGTFIHKISLMSQLIDMINGFPRIADARYANLRSLRQQAITYITNMLPQISLFQVKNPATGAVFGFDNYRFTSQTSGDVVLTSLVALKALEMSRYLDPAVYLIATPAVTDTSALVTAFRNNIVENVKWVLTKVDVAQGYIPNPLIADPVSNVGSNIVDRSFILQNMVDIQAILTAYNVAAYATTLTAMTTQKSATCAFITTQAQTLVTNQENLDWKYNSYVFSNVLLSLTRCGAAQNALYFSLSEQIHRYVQDKGLVSTPMGTTTNGAIRSASTTLFGALGPEREIEFAVYAFLALEVGCSSSGVCGQQAYSAQMSNIFMFLKKFQDYNGFFAAYRSTYLTNILLGKWQALYGTNLFLDSKYSVDFTFKKGAAVTPAFKKTFVIDGDYMPVTFVFNSVVLGLVQADANTQGTFTVDAYGLTNAATIFGSVQDSVLGYQIYFQDFRANQPSNQTSHHGLSFAVTALNQTYSATSTYYLGSAATVGQTYAYQISLENMLTNRLQKEVNIILRPPTCLTFNGFQLNDIKGPGLDKPIQAWNYYPASHEYRLDIRALNANGQAHDNVKFVVYGTQTSQGTCASRDSYASYVNVNLIRIFSKAAV